MTRRIVQIAACGVDNVSSTQCAYITTALCDDGTLWEQRNTSSDWRCFSPIPDAPILAEAPSASANSASDAMQRLCNLVSAGVNNEAFCSAAHRVINDYRAAQRTLP